MKAMDLLKLALAERQAKAQKVVADTGQKWVRRGELEQKRKEEYMESVREEDEKRKADEEAQLKKFEELLSYRKSEVHEEEEKAIPQHILNEALLGDDDAEPPVGLDEVLSRLREMAQPITLFGETDMVRYRRLRTCEKEIHEGKKNPDLVMLENVHMGQKMQALENDLAEEEAQKDNDEEEEDADSDDNEKAGGGAGADKASDKSDSEDEGEAKVVNEDKSDSEDEGDTGAQQKRAADMQAAADKARQAAAAGEDAAALKKAVDDLPDVDLGLMDQCDFIRGWARKALKAWEKELADLPEDEKKTAKCKLQVAQHRQVRRDVRPLQKRLRLYTMEAWLLSKLHIIVKSAAEREYRNAAEAYLDLSIGKAAWPVGIGCGGSMLMEDAIGLHDRFNRNAQVKDISFALNDDVTRKFVQALKRLMSCAQRFWPPEDPSKAA